MSEATTTDLPATESTRDSKRIILCSDGTGNKGGTGRDTNVWRLFTYLDLSASKSPHQIAFYDDGIGTQNFKLLKALGGAFGFGLTRNIRQLYTALVLNYEPGDKIYIFGFSRGAYTARVLAALICKCGIVRRPPNTSDREVDLLVREAMRHMRDSFDLPILTGWMRLLYSRIRNQHADAETFRKTETHDATNDPDGANKIVNFIGVWDTVSAIGTPVFGLTTLINTLLYRIDFPDRAVHHRINTARHALAIDDERATFHPMLWDEPSTLDNVNKLNVDREATDLIAPPDVLQIWFPGAHSNVGGGYPKQGLAYASLVWMMEAAGLDYRGGVSQEAKSRINPTDKLYDSRSGTAAYYRYRPREIAQYAKENTSGRTLIDTTVVERIYRSVDGYAPGNVPFDADVVDASGIRPQLVATPEASIRTVADALGAKGVSMHAEQIGYVGARQILHALLIVTTFAVVALLYLPDETGCVLERLGLERSEQTVSEDNWAIQGVGLLLPDSIGKHIQTLQSFFTAFPIVLWGMVAWLAFLYGLRFRLERNTEGVYRAFWRKVRDRWLDQPGN